MTTSNIIAYQLSGKYEHFCNGNSCMVREDTVVFINKSDYYEVTAHESGTCIAIHFNLAEPTDLPFSVVDCKTLPHMKADFIRAFNAWSRRDEYSFYDCASIFYGIIGKFLRCLNQDNAYVKREKYRNIVGAHDYMTANFNAPDLCMDDIAEIAGLSRRRFGELFRILYNMTPGSYLTHLRITSAKEMLRTRNYSVADIAATVGYTSTSYFCRVFANETGTSPGRWLES